MKPPVYIDIPSDIDAVSPDFLPVLNNRLQRFNGSLLQVVKELESVLAIARALDLPADLLCETLTARKSLGGYIKVIHGDATKTGYLELYKPDGTVLGTLGDSATDVKLVLAGGAIFLVSGDEEISGYLKLSALNASEVVATDASKKLTTIAGLTTALSVTVSVGTSAVSLQYKDHAGANQTQSVIVSVTPTNTTMNFTKGLYTS